MRYYGEFINQKGKCVSVDIYTVGDETRTPTPLDDNGISFASEEAVMIESDVNDTFDTRLCRNCSVTLLSDRALTDFYTLTPQEAVIKVDIDGEAIFRGYVQPLAFSQPFADSLDEVTIEAVDPLSVLESLPYARDWDAAIVQAQEKTLADFLADALTRGSEGLGLAVDIDCPTLTSDGSMPAMEAFSLSDSLFLGEEEDDMWLLEDVVDEILMYFDLKAEVRGTKISVYRTAPQTKNEIITQDIVADVDAAINIEEAFNKISVTAQRETMDEILPEPLDEDSLTSEYSRPALYSRACIIKGREWDSNTDDAYKFFAGHWMNTGNQIPKAYEERETYIKPLEHPRWTFKKGANYGEFMPGAGFFEGMMGEANACGTHIRAGIFKIGTVEPRPKTDDNEMPSKIDYKDTIVIGVGGERLLCSPSRFDVSDYTGVAKYTGSASGTALTPSDPDTTNYIVISGKIRLAPYLPHVSRDGLANYGPYPGPPQAGSVEYAEAVQKYEAWGNIIRSGGITDDSGEPYYSFVEWYNCEKATDSPVVQEHQTKGLLAGHKDIGKFLKIDNIVDHEQDRVRKVAVLRCMLRVGDKVLVESPSVDWGSGIYWNSDSVLLWATYKERKDCASEEEYLRQTFTLGFNPALGDYIVGQEYDIANTVHYSYNIDAEGLAIPIVKENALRGEVKFEVLGLVDLHYCRSTEYDATSEAQRVLPYVNHVELTDFKMELFSDNGHFDLGDDDDIVYTSDTDERYINEKDDITMRINTALSSSERLELGVSDAPAFSIPYDATTKAPALSVLEAGEEGKPEQFYVDRHWRESHLPRIEMDINLEDTDWQTGDVLRHPALPDKVFRIMGVGYDVQSGFSICRLREQC